MHEMLEIVLKLCVMLFMVGSLAGMGLELVLANAVSALRNVRFLALTLLNGFVVCPAVAWLVVKAIPIQAPYATGLLLLGMAPAAPFMPLVVKRAGVSEFGYTTAFMLIAACGTVIFMPIAAPLLIKGLSLSPWLIAKPLVFFVLSPLIAGIAIRSVSGRVASRLCPTVRLCTSVAAILMLVDIGILYGKQIAGLVGTYAVATQVLFIAVVTFIAFLTCRRGDAEQASALTLGVCTRNIGAAFAPAVAMNGDERTVVMVAVSVPVTVIASFSLARLLAFLSAKRVAATIPAKWDAASARR